MTYTSLCIPDDIEERGLGDVPNFLYRDDALQMWGIMHRFHTSILTHIVTVWWLNKNIQANFNNPKIEEILDHPSSIHLTAFFFFLQAWWWDTQTLLQEWWHGGERRGAGDIDKRNLWKRISQSIAEKASNSVKAVNGWINSHLFIWMSVNDSFPVTSSAIPQKLSTEPEMVKFVTMVMFTCSVQHAAVNCGQVSSDH